MELSDKRFALQESEAYSFKYGQSGTVKWQNRICWTASIGAIYFQIV